MYKIKIRMNGIIYFGGRKREKKKERGGGAGELWLRLFFCLSLASVLLFLYPINTSCQSRKILSSCLGILSIQSKYSLNPAKSCPSSQNIS
jgi:hypothetical protein